MRREEGREDEERRGGRMRREEGREDEERGEGG